MSADAAVFWNDERHGPLVVLLLALTMVTGLVDSISYLKLGHVFVANMTGNVVFLGFAVADSQEFSIPASLAAVAAFLGGALAGGRLGSSAGKHRGRLLALATSIEVALIGAALVVSALAFDLDGERARYSLIVLLALTMGLQNAVARRLGVPDLTTTVLTLTLTGFAADSKMAGGRSTYRGRRLMATLSMLLGAAVGAVLIFHIGVIAVLAVALAMLGSVGLAGWRVSSTTAPWTLGT